MLRITFGLVLVIGLTLGGGAPVSAKGGHSGSGSSGHMTSSHGMNNHGMSSHGMSSHNWTSFNGHGMTKSSFGYSFRSRPSGWGSRCWNSRYGCYCYYCPLTSCSYYWCAPYQCYYPVSYCPTGSYDYPEAGY